MRLVALNLKLKKIYLHFAGKENKIMTEPTLVDNGLIIKKPRKPHTYSMDFGMAFVTKDYEQTCAFVSCRDYMQDTVRTFLNNKKRVGEDGHSYYPDQGDPDLFMSRIRLLFRTSTNNDKKLLHAVKVLNILEKHGEMEITTAQKVHMRGEKGSLLLLKGSGEYMNNPHLLSMMTLIMRFCFYNKEFKVEKETCLKDNYKKINPDKDSHLMGDCYQIMHQVMKDRKSLFEGMTLKELFPIKIGYNFHSQGGIQQCCRANTPNKKANDRITKLKKKYIKD